MKILLMALMSISLIGCAALKRGQELGRKAGEYSKTHQYKAPMNKVVSGVKAQINLMSNLGRQGQRAQRPITDGKFVFKKQIKNVNRADSFDAYNVLKNSRNEVIILSKDNLYKIKDHRSHRTVQVSTISELKTERVKKDILLKTWKTKNWGTHRLSLPTGRYESVTNIDNALTNSQPNLGEQWVIINRVEPKVAKKVRLDLEKTIQ